jgi:hypothetical protein
MRLTCLLLMGLASMHVFSQSDTLDAVQQKKLFNKLSKYSYMIIPLGRNYRDSTVMRTLEIGTGFFLRQHGKLFLVSAYHVFTGCNMYNDTPRNEKPYAVGVRYKDLSGNYKVLQLPPQNFPPCKKAFEQEDVWLVEVPELFIDPHIYSIESMVRKGKFYSSLMADETVVGYGFPYGSSSVDSIKKGLELPPKEYLSKCISPPVDSSSQMVVLYYFIKPMLDEGISGAPIFRVRKRGHHKIKLDFVGIQSGSNTTANNSTIVKGYSMMQQPQLNKNRSTL